MIAYKGFLPGLICRGYQFRMGLNVTEKANCAHNGFHCAEDPLDCLRYYGDINHAEYYIVDAGGDIDEDGVDSKISCTELTILKRLRFLDGFFDWSRFFHLFMDGVLNRRLGDSAFRNTSDLLDFLLLYFFFPF